MALLERIEQAQRVESRSPWEDRCTYCGERGCPHAQPWQSRAWSSRASMREVLPTLLLVDDDLTDERRQAALALL